MKCGCMYEKPVCSIGRYLYQQAQNAYEQYVSAIVHARSPEKEDAMYVQAYAAWEEHRRNNVMITSCGCTKEEPYCEVGKQLQAVADECYAKYMESIQELEVDELKYQAWLDATYDYRDHLTEYSLRRKAKLQLSAIAEIELPVVDADEEATAEMAEFVTKFISRSLEEGKQAGKSERCSFSLSASWIDE